MERNFSFSAKVWLYPGKAGWHFVNVPTTTTEEIDFYFSHAKRGWGSLPITVTLGKTTWETSIFPDKKSHTYLLPLKAHVRKEENIQNDKTYSFTLTIKV